MLTLLKIKPFFDRCEFIIVSTKSKSPKLESFDPYHLLTSYTHAFQIQHRMKTKLNGKEKLLSVSCPG